MSIPIEKLFTPLTLGGKNDPIVLQHRVAMAPLTRLRADGEGTQPASAATYYAQRATIGGLLVAEATNISATARGHWRSPGIFTKGQIASWKAVTDAVHAKGGVIFLQLWHTGRMGHKDNQPGGILPVSSTGLRPPESDSRKVVTKDGRVPISEYRALKTEEIPAVCQDYQDAAVNAIAAGFDGVELHAANGYLLEQFLHDGTNNDRADQYGGSMDNRTRFLFEALDAIVAKVDSSKVALRISPFGVCLDQRDSTPIQTYQYILNKLNDYDLAYLHVIEPRAYHPENPLTPAHGAAHELRQVYKGVLMMASGYDRESAVDVVEKGDAGLVAVGRFFISNPDLVQRFQQNAPLADWDFGTFYAGEEHGYIDYPFLTDSITPLTEVVNR